MKNLNRYLLHVYLAVKPVIDLVHDIGLKIVTIKLNHDHSRNGQQTAMMIRTNADRYSSMILASLSLLIHRNSLKSYRLSSSTGVSL